MKKKVLAMVLAGVMVFGLAACGNKTEDSNAGADTPDTSGETEEPKDNGNTPDDTQEPSGEVTEITW